MSFAKLLLSTITFSAILIRLFVYRLVLMDVNARRIDIEAAENPDVDMDEIFSMEPEDLKTCT